MSDTPLKNWLLQQRGNGTLVVSRSCPSCGGGVTLDMWSDDIDRFELTIIFWNEHIDVCARGRPTMFGEATADALGALDAAAVEPVVES